MAALDHPAPDDRELARSQPDWEAHLQAQLDWLMSDDDPWAPLEEEPPCFCTARLSHKNAPALQIRLTRAFPELQAVQPPGPALLGAQGPDDDPEGGAYEEPAGPAEPLEPPPAR